jgi:hypothetical protein
VGSKSKLLRVRRGSRERGLTVDACRQAIGAADGGASNPPARTDGTSNPPASTESGSGRRSSPDKAETSFLEAALFFITGVDATSEDSVTEREIVLRREPIVAYLVDSNPCAFRIRTTTQPYTVWQWDFCKITHYQGGGLSRYDTTVLWMGHKTAFCIYRGWNKNENYTGPIDEQNCRGVFNETAPLANGYTAWNSYLDIGSLIDRDKPRGGRSRDRMIASFKYIVTLLRGKPY